MGKGRRYDQEYKDMIVELFKSGMSLAELSSEYGIAKSTINGWVKDVKEIKVDENEVMTLKEVKALKKEMARIKEENEILHQLKIVSKTISIFSKMSDSASELARDFFALERSPPIPFSRCLIPLAARSFRESVSFCSAVEPGLLISCIA